MSSGRGEGELLYCYAAGYAEGGVGERISISDVGGRLEGAAPHAAGSCDGSEKSCECGYYYLHHNLDVPVFVHWLCNFNY